MTNTEQFLELEKEQLDKLNTIVLKTVEEEKLLSEKLLEFEDRNPPFVSRMTDKIAQFGGSWKFVISFALVMALWIILNSYFFIHPFDPFPFIFLNLVLSTIAALQAPLIMMSQNRKEEKDRQRAVNDYMINLKSEIEVRNLHGKLDLLMTEQMKTLFEIQKTQMNLMEDIRKLVDTGKRQVKK
ncbi:DUF1003 domain-containing protein [Ferruginibacter sp. HRS2-29]|uniref:DUF1003 domain-containing protein n=1 Tax=Ferruginibacter sp. HRS2-29 TaxID=2487334 RepID=UPI0020CF50C2|nr:DUF1003 domain-containing protein [Ferruginibacter sp. HRS2-29]MCP9753156.1 DUF1003 domain-containing protein [Ferruginibacter sp. HRS2-29]